jgi:hypothetical protein
MSAQRYFFPQDEIWKSANELKLTMLKVRDNWAIEYTISGSIGADPFADQEDEGTDGGLLEEPGKIDPAAFLQSVVSELNRKVR